MPEKRPKERDEPSLAHPAESVQIGTIEFSVERDQIAPAMLAVQEAVGTIPYDSSAVVKHKDGTSHSYRYTSLTGILAAVLPPMHANKLFLVGGGGGGTTVGTTTCVMHISGQWAQNTIPISTNGAAQAVGSAVSYGRRYGLPALLGLACDEDDTGLRAQQSLEEGEEDAEKFSTDMLMALPQNFRTPLEILGWKTGKCKAMLAKFVDDTGSLDRPAALAFLNHEVDKLAQGGDR